MRPRRSRNGWPPSKAPACRGRDAKKPSRSGIGGCLVEGSGVTGPGRDMDRRIAATDKDGQARQRNGHAGNRGRRKDGWNMAVLVTGGARSGQSRFAERYAETLGTSGLSVATTTASEDEPPARVRRQRR